MFTIRYFSYLSLLSLFIMLSSITSATPLKVGASYNDVIAALGEPDGDLNAGSRRILSYGQAQIKLTNGTVTSISPELEQLLAQRNADKASIEAKRKAGLVNYNGKWIRPGEQEVYIAQKNEKRAERAALAMTSAGAWITDFEQAKVLAAAQKKKILINFTGSTWCGPCIKLEREVLSQQEFIEHAKKHYILVKIDFPKSSRSVILPKATTDLAQKYKIRHFPTIIVTKSNGKRIATSGYVQGGPQAFIASLN